jgi:riboflavin transporter FmnP
MKPETYRYNLPSLRIAVIAGLIASAIVLHLFKIPYPPATFLKFDLSGVPLAIAAFITLIGTTVFGLPVFYLGVFALGGAMDPIGPAMKVLAELSTYLPLIAIYRRSESFTKSLKGLVFILLVAVISRTSVMCLANLAVTPYWLQIMGWVKRWEEAWNYTLFILPHIAIFNAIAAAYIVLLSLPLIRIAKAMGVVILEKKSIKS